VIKEADPQLLTIPQVRSRTWTSEIIQSVSPSVFVYVPIMLFNVGFFVWPILNIERWVGVLSIEQDGVAHITELATCIVVAGGTLPQNLVAKIRRPEDGILHYFELVARRRVAMQVQTSSWLQYSMKLCKSSSHHH